MRCYRLANFFVRRGHKCLIYVDNLNKNFLNSPIIKNLYKRKENFKNELMTL